MKKMLIYAVVGIFASGSILIMVCIAVFLGGNGDDISSPVGIFASEDEAYAYQYIGSELGVPWDIVMLSDGIHAYAAGETSLKNYNPMITSLEFCILQEEQYILEYIEVDDGTESDEGKEGEDGEAVEENQKSESAEEEGMEAEGEDDTQEEKNKDLVPTWIPGEIVLYTGCDEILNYIGKDKETAKVNYRDVSGIVADISAAAEEKGIEDEIKYEITLLTNPDYEAVLKDFVGLSDEHIGYVMQLYEASYLAGLYGYTFEFADVILPEIVVGSVTREELARVAASIIGHPYLMGGKSSEAGAPTGPLDCSGYVDWVYVQCFGIPVGNGGTVPEGVSVSGTAIQWFASEEISQKDLKVGDLGFVRNPASIKNGQVNHVGIYLGNYDGKDYWIHCGGSAYGTADTPKGRVGISLAAGLNSYNPVDGSDFSPAMKGCKFKYFRRPRFEFLEE